MKKIIIAVLVLIIGIIGMIMLCRQVSKTEFTPEEIENGYEYQLRENKREEMNKTLDRIYGYN